MKPTNVDKQSVGASTPGLFAASRNRLMSFNTPQLSPLKMVQSPFMALGEGSIFDSHLSLNNDFRLEEGPPQDDTFQQVNESS